IAPGGVWTRGIEKGEAIVGSAAIRPDEELASDIVDDLKGIVGNFFHVRRAVFFVPGKITIKDGIALFPRALVGNVENCVPFVFGCSCSKKTLGMGPVFVDQLVVRLRRSEALKKDSRVFVLARKLVPRLGRIIAVVEKRVSSPRKPRDLEPLQVVRQTLSCRHFQHMAFLPVRTSGGYPVGAVFA